MACDRPKLLLLSKQGRETARRVRSVLATTWVPFARQNPGRREYAPSPPWLRCNICWCPPSCRPRMTDSPTPLEHQSQAAEPLPGARAALVLLLLINLF